MTVVVTSKNELIVPRSVRRKAGIRTGDRVEFKVSGGVINIIPKLSLADDEYTPAERLALDARLAEARKGPHHGPFETADDAIKFIRREIKTRKGKQRRLPKS
jgi:AbrB family looped-hinge helix DNA binding protein